MLRYKLYEILCDMGHRLDLSALHKLGNFVKPRYLKEQDKGIRQYFKEISLMKCTNCDEMASGMGQGKPYCSKCLWQEFDRVEGMW